MATWGSLSSGQLGTGSFSALVTASGQTAVTALYLTNIDSTTHTFDLQFKESGGTARYIAKGVSLTAGQTVNFCDGPDGFRMSPGDIVQGEADAGSVIDFVILGVLA